MSEDERHSAETGELVQRVLFAIIQNAHGLTADPKKSWAQAGHAVDAVLPLLVRAWDEGYNACIEDGISTDTQNPYRTSVTPPGLCQCKCPAAIGDEPCDDCGLPTYPTSPDRTNT